MPQPVPASIKDWQDLENINRWFLQLKDSSNIEAKRAFQIGVQSQEISIPPLLDGLRHQFDRVQRPETPAEERLALLNALTSHLPQWYEALDQDKLYYPTQGNPEWYRLRAVLFCSMTALAILREFQGDPNLELEKAIEHPIRAACDFAEWNNLTISPKMDSNNISWTPGQSTTAKLDLLFQGAAEALQKCDLESSNEYSLHALLGMAYDLTRFLLEGKTTPVSGMDSEERQRAVTTLFVQEKGYLTTLGMELVELPFPAAAAYQAVPEGVFLTLEEDMRHVFQEAWQWAKAEARRDFRDLTLRWRLSRWDDEPMPRPLGGRSLAAAIALGLHNLRPGGSYLDPQCAVTGDFDFAAAQKDREGEKALPVAHVPKKWEAAFKAGLRCVLVPPEKQTFGSFFEGINATPVSFENLEQATQTASFSPELTQYLQDLISRFKSEEDYWVRISGHEMQLTAREMKREESPFRSEPRPGDEEDIIEAVTDIPKKPYSTLLIGEPGGGKTTTLWQIALDQARGILAGRTDARLPIFVELKAWKPAGRLPKWQDGTVSLELAGFRALVCQSLGWLHGDETTLPKFWELYRQLFEQRRLLFLLDGLNEISGWDPNTNPISSLNSILEELLKPHTQEGPRHKAIITCRTLHYPHGLAHLTSVELVALDRPKIEQYLGKCFSAEQKKRIRAELDQDLQEQEALGRPRETSLWAMLGNPFFLYLLRSVAEKALKRAESSERIIPPSRGRLIQEFVVLRLDEEIKKGASFMPDNGREIVLHALSQLAFAMMDSRTGMEATDLHLQVDRAWATRENGIPDAEYDDKPFDRGKALDWADEAHLVRHSRSPSGERVVSFWHQLIQEYFVAIQLEKNRHPGPPTTAFTDEDYARFWERMTDVPRFERTEGNAFTPLPGPPQRGWQEVTVLLAGIHNDPETFVRTVARNDPVMAARCLIDGRPQIEPKRQQALVTDTIIPELLKIIEDPKEHVRWRIAAAHVLGDLGDPRIGIAFPEGVALHAAQRADFILPKLEKIECAGQPITLGTTEEQKRDYDQQLRVLIKELAYDLESLFPEAARYDLGQKSGKEISEQEIRKRTQELEKQYKEGFLRVINEMKDGRGGHLAKDEDPFRWKFTDNYWMARYPVTNREYRCFVEDNGYETDDWWPRETGAREWLEGQKKGVAPLFWNRPQFNRPSLPVVGVCWYEAEAYCRWLTHKIRGTEIEKALLAQCTTHHSPRTTHQIEIRLPSEAEWERAARGPDGRLWPWATREARNRKWKDAWETDIEDFSHRVNIATGPDFVASTTPVGIYPKSVTPEGVHDLCGNVWEWCRSLYSERYSQEDIDPKEFPRDRVRVLRGGAWDGHPNDARPANRAGAAPDSRDVDGGFRVVMVVRLRLR